MSNVNKIIEKNIAQQSYNLEQKSEEIADKLMSINGTKEAVMDFIDGNEAHFKRQMNPNHDAFRLFSPSGKANAYFNRSIGRQMTSSRNQAAFTQSGSMNIADYNAVVDGLVWQIGSTLDDKFSLSSQFPDKPMPATDQIFVEWIEGAKGLAQDYLYGDNVPEVRRLSRGAYSYVAPAVREQKIYREQDILVTRQLGSGNFAERGVLQQVAYDSLDGYVKMLSKKKVVLSNFVFNGAFTFSPSSGSAPITVTSGVPAGNTLVPIGAVWGTPSGGTYIPNSAANPILDLMYWFSSAGPLKRLLGMVKSLVMNPNTQMLFLENANTIAYANRILTNSALMNSNDVFSMAKVAEITIPSLKKFDIVVDYSGYQPDVVTSGVPVDTTALTYFIPDGYIMFELEIPSTYGSPLGDFVYLGQLQNGGFQNPNPGPFIVLEDNTVPGSRGGLGNPFLSLIYGYAGGPRIRRPNDLIIAKVIA